jgi:hypothetical protein
MDPHLLVDVGQVALDGALGQVQRRRYPRVGKAAGGQKQHLQLPGREHPLVALPGDLQHGGGHPHHRVGPLGVEHGGAHRDDELLGRVALEQVGVRLRAHEPLTWRGFSSMVTITTLGRSGKERIASSVSLDLSTGICTCMTTASGRKSRARRRASSSLGT